MLALITSCGKQKGDIMQYLKRKNLTKKFEFASSSPLLIVYTPKGFGKRTFISRYLNDRKKEHVWFHLVNNLDEEWQWKSFQDKLMNAMDVMGKLPYFPMPKTQEELSNMLDLYSEYVQEEYYIVIDGITGVYPKLQTLVSLFSFLSNARFHMILICDSLHNEFLTQYTEHVKFLKIDDFRMSYHDVIEAGTKEKIVLSKEKVHSILTYTDGWISAIELILMTLKKGNVRSETNSINMLIDQAFYQPLAEDVKKDFMYLSILNEFTLEQLYALCESKESIKKILQMVHNQLFIHGTPSIGYTISGLLKDFLKIKLYDSDVDINTIYQRIAKWYSSNNEPIQAITMYLKCNDFAGIVRILKLHYEQSFMDNAPSLMIEVFQRMPMEYKYANPYVYLSHMLDIMTNKDSQQGVMLLDEFKQDVEQGKYEGDTQYLLGEYYFIRAFSKYNDASLMMDDFERSSSALQGGKSRFCYPFMIASFGSFHLLYLYHRKEGELASLVEDIVQRNHTLVHLSNGVCGGGEYQARAEYAFETGNYAEVLELSHNAYLETERYQQVSLKICTLFLRLRYAIMMQDTMLHEEMMNELNAIYQTCSLPVLRSEIECVQAYLCMLEGNTRKVPSWVENEKILYPQLLYEAGMISFIILCFYQICTKNYTKIAYYCTILEGSYKVQMHVFGALYAKIFQAIACFHLNHKEDSFIHLHNACTLAQGDHLITIFKELSPHLKVVLDEFVAETPFELEVKRILKEQKSRTQEQPIFHLLTRKEKEVMLKYASDMTTKQISEEMMLSINTVQTHLKSIYSKLRINSKIQLVQLVNKQQVFNNK